jgi:hypothetical protein
MRVEVVVGAAVLAHDEEGLPVVLANRLGRGTMICALPVPEAQAAEVAGERAARDWWQRKETLGVSQNP